MSTPELPVSAANYAWGGSPSLVFMPLLHRMMEACRPQVVVLQGWTANDGPSEAAAVAYADQIISTAQRARQLGAVPILVTRFCRSTLAARDSERMVADRLRQAQLSAASAEMPVIDATAVLEDPAHPGAFRPGLSQDGIHPNDAGHAAVAALLTPVLRGLLAEAALSLVEHRPSFTGSDLMFNKLRMSLGLTPIAPAHAIAPAGDYEVRGRRCIGAITDECNPTRVPMTIQVETSGRSLLQEMQAPYDPNHRDYRFALELDSRVTPRDLLAEQVLLYARNAFGLRAKLALDGASQLTLIREHLGKPRDVLFDLDLTQGGNGVAFMREGWCGPEPEVCCTDGPRAVLEVPIAIAPDQRYELTIACFPFLDPAVQDQRMTVTINGFPQQAMMDSKMLEFLSFVFPTNSVAGGDATTIEFEFPDCYAPADLGRNEDRRRLSFGFKQLVLARLLPLTLEV